MSFWNRFSKKKTAPMVEIPQPIEPTVAPVEPPRPGVVSYSQCGEDLIADFIFRAQLVSTGTFLDIGAAHPTELNNTHFFYCRGWRGFNVDPIASNIALFDAERPEDRNICAGIGEESGERNFYRMTPSTLSTFDEATARSYAALGHAIEEVSPVPFLSAIDLFESHAIPHDLDLLSLDIEGGERSVLRSLVAGGIRPKVLIVETIGYGRTIAEAKKQTDLISEIEALGYMVYGDTYINTIFVEKNFCGV